MRYREIIEAIKNDDDMFSTSSTLATGAKQAIKQIEDPYLRTVRRVRELAKTKFGIKTRVSSVPKSASRGRATFWFGDYVRDSNDPYDKAPEAPPVAQEIKAELERQGFECKFTGSGWLSVLVPPAYSDLLREENDEELFGRPGGKFAGMTGQEVIDHWDELQQELYGYEAYWDDDNDPEFLQKENELKALMRYARIRFGEGFYQYLSKWGEHSDAQYARHRERSNADPFSNRRYREDPRVTKAGKLHKQDALGLRNDIKARIGTHTQPVLPESNDDDMFGSSTRPDSKVIAQDLELWLRRRQSSSRRPIIPSSENYVKQVIAAFNQSFLKGVETWREYPLYGNTDIKYDIREYLENSLNVNLMDYVDQVNENDESDDELFGGTQTPPKTAQALYQWSRMDPNRYNFRAIAEFSLSHKLTLKQALQVTSRFDEYDDRMQAEYGVDDDEMGDLFGAYEEVCDAWNTDPSGNTSTNDSWEKLGEADAELEEPPERPRKTTTKTKPDIKFDIPFQQDQDQPLAHTDPLDDLKKKAGVGDKPTVNLRKASQKDTLSKTSGLSTPDMGDMLGRMRDIELDKDLEPYQDEPPENLPSVDVNTQNLPAVAGQALQAAGVQNPEFHQVSNLPGNMADQIRQLGKSLFGSLTMTPTKRIHVVANLGGQGPNSTQEVNAVAGFLKKHGDDRGPGDIDFEQVMPGYKAQTHMYTAAGIRWMLVKDFAGQYIYCWPEEDSHDASPGLEHDQPEMKRLK